MRGAGASRGDARWARHCNAPGHAQRLQRRVIAARALGEPLLSSDGTASPDAIASYVRDGFLVVPNFASPDEVAAMKARAEQLVEDFDPQTVSVFSTRRQESTLSAESARDYFLDSANNISFFFEEDAFDPDTGALRQAKSHSINKIGHAMHDLDPVFREFSRSPKMASLLESLGYRRPTPVQSMYIFKQPKIGGEVVPHQDSTFLHTSPPSVIGIWLALEDATVENGCLWGWPGSHTALRSGDEPERRMLLDSSTRDISFDPQDPVEHDLTPYKAIEVPAGTLVLFHGAFYHLR